ncbi:type II secretion system minor pseudopilin GspI [Vagococcus sp. WN89Y]|uniref:type II secretion system minor pseudopilin GspI n=1 Tax=Vagococcus sp. WN89Y TaxID=3457258 RepID=UPI003FCDB666
MKRAFTLLEVMVALAIFALTALATMHVASVSLRNTQLLQEKMVAGWVADNQMALLALMPAHKRILPQTGQSEMAGTTWYWKASPVATTGDLLQALEVEVSDDPAFTHTRSALRAWFVAAEDERHGS